jgi:hypothetical protein
VPTEVEVVGVAEPAVPALEVEPPEGVAEAALGLVPPLGRVPPRWRSGADEDDEAEGCPEAEGPVAVAAVEAARVMACTAGVVPSHASLCALLHRQADRQ